MKEAKGAGTVTVAAVGPERAKTGLRECLARGADDAIWVDSTGTAVSRRARRRQGPRGRREGREPTTSSGSARRASATTSRWSVRCSRSSSGVPHVGSVMKLEIGDGKITAHREIEGAHEVVECTAAGRADGAEGPERAALRLAQGDHGGQEEADRREEARGARRARGGSRAGEDALAQARAAAGAPGLQMFIKVFSFEIF